MAKNGSIRHYRQVGSSREPSQLLYGEVAVAKDGTLFAGNQYGQAISRVDAADTAAQATHAYHADNAQRASASDVAEKLRAQDSSIIGISSPVDVTPSVNTANSSIHFVKGEGEGSVTVYAYTRALQADNAAHSTFSIGGASLAHAGGKLRVGGISGLEPATDGGVALGAPGARFSAVYASTGAVSTSDRRAKNNMKRLDAELAQNFVRELFPVTYRLNDGQSGRRHWGMIAQDVESAMARCGLTDKDFGGYVRSPKPGKGGRAVPGEFEYGLRYEEFIAPLVACVQQLMRDRDELAARVRLMESQMGWAARTGAQPMDP